MLTKGGGPAANNRPMAIRGRGILTATRNRRLLSRGRGRGWHVEKIREHRQSLDEMIAEDPLFQSSQLRNVKSPKKIPPNFTKGRLSKLFCFDHQHNIKYFLR